jgi:putative NADH-flavin reductase
MYSDNHTTRQRGGTMRLAVVGATGHTGGHVVTQAVARGYEVLALARRPDAVAVPDTAVEARFVDVLDDQGVAEALAGADAVVSTLGIGTSREPTVTYSQGVRNILAAMSSNGIGRLVVTSAAPAGPREDQPFIERRVVMPILERFFGATYRDMRRMEATLGCSEVPWVALRPPRLLDKPATGTYRMAAHPIRGARSLTFPDLATALLDALERPGLAGTALYVAN